MKPMQQSQVLNIIYIFSSVQVPSTIPCIQKKTAPEKLTDILPRDNKDVMLIFPFDCLGKMLDALSNELLIYGCPAFRVRDNSVFFQRSRMIHQKIAQGSIKKSISSKINTWI